MESSNFQPPVRRSLSNEELEARVNQAMTSHSGVESVMELLVAQETLRAQEDQEEANWVASMQSNGSIEALTALENFRRQTPGYVPQQVVPAAQPEPIDQPEPLAPVFAEEPIQAVVVEPVDEPAIQFEPEVIEQVESPEPPKLEQVFPWLNPSPPSPEFRAAEPTPVVPVVEEVIEQAAVVEEPVVEQQPKESSFSWFSQSEVTPAQPAVEHEQEVQPEVLDLEPVGSETETEFERLLAAAAAEEELTALEELETKPGATLDRADSNVLIPSDEHRNRGPASQLFVWLGLSATIVPILLVWALIGFGLDEIAVAGALATGYLVSAIFIGVGAIAGKRSGLSTAIISRSVFGVWGNSIPLTINLISRIAVTAIMLGTFTFMMNGSETSLPDFSNTLISISGLNFTIGLAIQVVLLVLVSLVVIVRGNVSRIIQVFLSLLAFALVVESFAVLTLEPFSFNTVGSIDMISLQGLAGVSLVVMVNLTLWFALAPNISKAIPMKVKGINVFSAVLVSNFAAPVLVGVGTIFWLGTLSVSATSESSIQSAIQALPAWVQGSLNSGILIAIMFAAMLSIRTATLDVSSLFRIKARIPALLVAFALTAGFLLLFAQQPVSQEVEYLANLFVLMAALSAGWIGIVAADIALRRLAYHELSLSRSYGLYKKFNILSLLTWVLTLVIAVALVPVNLLGFSFMGFAIPMLGIELNLASSAIGFVATVLSGIVLTLAIRIHQIKKQERELLALEARRDQLNDIFVSNE
jgi:purine-cytosine permease-like protein